jgi:hypothetical protein
VFQETLLKVQPVGNSLSWIFRTQNESNDGY